MTEIVASVKRVADLMGEITAATHEQTSGIEQINQAISQIDEVTQQNATLVEEASAAAKSLQDQATQLNRAVSVFDLDPSLVSVQSRLALATEDDTVVRESKKRTPQSRPTPTGQKAHALASAMSKSKAGNWTAF